MYLSGRISWSIFTKIGTDVRSPKSKNEFVRGQYRSTPPLFCSTNPHIRPRGPKTHENIKSSYICLNYTRIADIFGPFRKSGSRNTMVTSDFRPEVEIRPFRACAMKYMQYNPYLWPSRWNLLWGRYHVPQNVFLVNIQTRCLFGLVKCSLVQ